MGAGSGFRAREDEPFAGARPFAVGLELLAIPPRYVRPPTSAGSDAGFLALDATGEPIGAAWYRLFPRSDPGFGYVGTRVPELIIGVRPIWRAHGVGRTLLQALTQEARSAGYARLSLSVERGNFAVTLYRSEGFAVTQSGIGRDTMVKLLR